MLEKVEHRKQSAPGVSAQRELLEAVLRSQRVQIGDVLPPADLRVPRNGGLAAAALVVIKERAPSGEEVVLGKEIVVTRTGPAMQHHNQRTASDLPRE